MKLALFLLGFICYQTAEMASIPAAKLEISKRQAAGGLSCDCSDDKYDTDTNTSFETSFERDCWTDCQDEDRTKRDDAAARLEISKRQTSGGRTCDCSDDKYDADITSMETSFERECWTDCQDEDRTKRDDAAARLEISKRQTAGGLTCDCSDEKYDTDTNTSFETSFERECWTDCQDEDRTKRDDAAAKLKISKRQARGSREDCDCDDDKYDTSTNRSFETSYERDCWNKCQL